MFKRVKIKTWKTLNRFMAGKGVQSPLNIKLLIKNTEIWITESRKLAALKVVNKINSRLKFLNTFSYLGKQIYNSSANQTIMYRCYSTSV